MTSIAAELDDAITEAVTGLRETGYSWADILPAPASLARRHNSLGEVTTSF